MAPARARDTEGLRPDEITVASAARLLGISVQHLRRTMLDALGARIIRTIPVYAVRKTAVYTAANRQQHGSRRPEAAPTSDTMTPREVAELLQTSTSWVYGLDAHLRPTIVPRGRHQVSRIYDREVVEAYARERAARRIK